jgi:hypothetical protein
MSSGGTVGTAHATMVNSCVATSSTATLILSGTSTGFAVYVRNAGIWKYTASSNVLSAAVTNYNVATQGTPT